MSINVECFVVPGCPNCAGAQAALREVVAGFGAEQVQWRDVDILEEIDYAIDLGVVGASALAIDGELVFPKLPKPEALRRELFKRLENESTRQRAH
jgi:thioredoxin 1